MTRIIKIFSINILIFLILILSLEIILGYLINKKSNLDCHYLLCDRTFKYETDLHNTINDYEIIYSRDSFGFRDRHKSFDEIDILVVGGSTTDERYLNDEDTWTNLLQKKLSRTNNSYRKKDELQSVEQFATKLQQWSKIIRIGNIYQRKSFT